MNKQYLLEKSFNSGDLITVYNLQSDQDVDFSFQDNIVLKTIALNSIYNDYFDIIQKRKECNISNNIPELLILAAKNNNNELISKILYSFQSNILTQLDYDFFLEICKIKNEFAIKEITQSINNLVKLNALSIQQFFDFSKNGIIYIIEHLTYELYEKINYLFINCSFEDFLIIKSIIKLPISNKKWSLVNNICSCQQDFLESDFVIDIDFINKYSKNANEFNALKSFCYNSISSLIYKEIPNDNIFYNKILYKIYNNMTKDVNDFYGFTKEYILHTLILKNNLSNNVILDFVKQLPPNEIVISAIFLSKNYLLFQELYEHYDFDKKVIDFSLINVFQNSEHIYDLLKNKNDKLVFESFLNKIIESENTKIFISDTSNVIDIIKNSSTIFIYIFCKIPNLLKEFEHSEYNLSRLYISMMELSDHTVLNYFIQHQILFDKINLQFIFDNTKFPNNQLQSKLKQAVNLFGF